MKKTNKMSLKTVAEQNGNEFTITEEREDYMIPPSFDGNPTFRTAHFLKPLLNSDLQSLSKTPLLSLSSNPNLTHNPAVRKVYFNGSNNSLGSWKSWVDDLQKTHQSIWKKVGIFDAIKSSIYHVRRDNQLIKCLAEKWCIQTNTFVFSWGECTVTLEDIMVLGGFSVMGDSVLIQLSHSKKFVEIKDELIKSCILISKKCSNSLTQIGWMDYFKGKGGDIEHVALIVMWLSRFVFYPKQKSSRINKSVIDIAISLALGIKIALAPAVLASIYRDLTLLKERIACQNTEGLIDSSDLVLCAPFHLLQLWAWERFPALSPKPNCLFEGEPRMARWHNVTKLKDMSSRLDVESDAEKFVWRPYALCLRNWDSPKFYYDVGMWVVINSEVDEELLSFVRCLRASELVGLDCVMQYLPHRVGMQFGMDQDIPNFVPRSNADLELAWSTYDKPLEGVKLYIAPRLFEGNVTMQYATWWRQVLSPGDDALITYQRHKRSAKIHKSLYQLLRDKESQKQQNVVNELLRDTIPVEDIRHMMNEHYSKGNNAQDIKAINQDVVGNGSDVHNDKSSFFNKSNEPQVAENEATDIGLEVEENFEHSETKLDENKEVSESNKNVGDGGKHTQGAGMRRGEGPPSDTELNALLGENVEDVHHNVGEDADIKESKTLVNDIVVISDEEDNVDCNHFEELSIDFEARINELDRIVSALKAAKSRAMVG